MKLQLSGLFISAVTLASGTILFPVNAAEMTTATSSSARAMGSGGQINFTGSVTDSACNIVSGSTSQNIDLGKWASNYFTNTGSETTKTPFHIKVQNCPSSVRNVAVLFDGQQDPTESTLLAVTGGASGVGIRLTEADRSTSISLGTISRKYAVKAGNNNNGSADLTFYASYRATAEKVTPGNANAVVNFAMVYN